MVVDYTCEGFVFVVFFLFVPSRDVPKIPVFDQDTDQKIKTRAR